MSFPTFRAAQVQTNQIIVSGNNGSNARLLIYGSESVTNNLGGYNLSTTGIGTDVFLFITGSKSTAGIGETFGTILFGGDLVTSGGVQVLDALNVYGSAVLNGDTLFNGNPSFARVLTASQGLVASGVVTRIEGIIDVSVDSLHAGLFNGGIIIPGGIAAIIGPQLLVEECVTAAHSIKGDITLGQHDAGKITIFNNSSSFRAPVNFYSQTEVGLKVNGISLHVFSGSTTTNGSGNNTNLLDEWHQGSNLTLSDGSVAFYKFIGTAVAENGNAAATWEIDVSAFRSGVTVFASSTVINKHTLGTNSNLAELFDIIVSSVNNGDNESPMPSPGAIRFLVNDGSYGSNVAWWGKVINRTECSLSGSFF